MFQISNQWMLFLLDVSTKALMLAVFAGIALKLLKLRDSNVQHRVWSSVLAGMLLLPVLALLLPAIPLSIPTNWGNFESTVEHVPLETTHVANNNTNAIGHLYEGNPKINRTLGNPEVSVSPPESVSPTTSQDVEISDTSPVVSNGTNSLVLPSVPGMLFLFWIAVTLAFAVRLAAGLWLSSRLLRRGVIIDGERIRQCLDDLPTALSRRVPTIRESNEVRVPVTVGWLRPTVLLPKEWETWTRVKLSAIVAHEFTHVARRDFFVVLAAELNRCLYWFHPVSWWLRNRLSDLAEEACDDAAIGHTDDRTGYARHLLEVATSLTAGCGRRVQPGLSMARESNVESRIATILDFKRPLSQHLTWRTATTIVLIAILFTTTAAAIRPMLATASPDEEPTVATEVAASTQDAQANTKIIRGTITGPDGKPAAGAFVAVVGEKRIYNGWGVENVVLAEGIADSAGRYELSLQSVPLKTYINTNLIARTEQSGIAWHRLNWHRLDLGFDQRTLDFKLQPQQLIRVRLVDLEGQPAAQLPVELSSIRLKSKSHQYKNFLSIYHLNRKPNAWSPATKTDDRGLVTISNISAEHGVRLKIPGTAKFAPQRVYLDYVIPEVEKTSKPGEIVTKTIKPAQFVEGIVLLGDTGKPAANARITIATSQGGSSSSLPLEGKTDKKGRFRLNPNPGVLYRIKAYPPHGTPYFALRLNVPGPSSGAGVKNIEIKLHQGLTAHGTIVDSSTGKPIRDASVRYYAVSSRQNRFLWDGTANSVTQNTDDKGNFKITVVPGPGTLIVRAARGSYILQEVGSQELMARKPGGQRQYAHGFHKINPTAGETLEAMKITLKPGGSVAGTLKDTKGKPIDHAIVVSRLMIPQWSYYWSGYPDEAHNGRFEINGLREGVEYPVSFLDRENRLGATAMLSTKNASPKIVLKPCGSAIARFVDPDGKPIVNKRVFDLYMIVTTGKPKHDRQAYLNGEMTVDSGTVRGIDRINYKPMPITNEKGVLTFPALIPGARYQFITFSDMLKGNGKVTKEFVAKSGETFDMGVIELKNDK